MLSRGRPARSAAAAERAAGEPIAGGGDEAGEAPAAATTVPPGASVETTDSVLRPVKSGNAFEETVERLLSVERRLATARLGVSRVTLGRSAAAGRVRRGPPRPQWRLVRDQPVRRIARTWG
jgi:hypothetical protein